MYKWARRDLNSRPPGYQPGAPTNLSYEPKDMITRNYCFHIKNYIELIMRVALVIKLFVFTFNHAH